MVKQVNRCSELPLPVFTFPFAEKEYFLREFKDLLLLKEDLKEVLLKPMIGRPMRIHLKEDAVPFAIHTPREISFAF